METTPDRNVKSMSRFLDVLFALALFRIVEYLPSFVSSHWIQLPHGLLSLLVSSKPNLVRVTFGLITITYLFATLSVASMAFILLFIYALGYLSLRYAIHAGLTPSTLRSTAERLARIDLSNPLTAIVATGLSWSGLTIWTLSWFVFSPLFSILLGRRRPA